MSSTCRKPVMRLDFSRGVEPARPLAFVRTDDERVRDHLLFTAAPDEIDAMLLHWHLVENVRRKLNIKHEGDP